jgi:threonine dehydrogenase-like Zn-dependent dehydrogenase
MKAVVFHGVGDFRLDDVLLQLGNCPHRKYIPRLVEAVVAEKADPLKVLTEFEPMTDAISAYKTFDKRKFGWVKVDLNRNQPWP